MAGVVSTVNQPLNLRPLVNGAFTPGDIAYDYALGGIPLIAASGQFLTAYQRARVERTTAPYKKAQFDSATDVGEQSLVYWWLRSQSSFHGGAGQNFLDGNGNTEAEREVRFRDSRGVDPWVPGEVSVLPKMSRLPQTAARAITGLITSGSYGAYYIDAAARLYYVADVRDTVTAHTLVTTAALSSITTDANSYYVVSGTTILRGTIGSTTAPVQIYAGVGANAQLAFVKARLMLASGGALYELNGAVAAGANVLPTALYTHPTSGWVWQSWAEGPQGIYVSGQLSAKSSVFLIGLNTSGAAPVLSAPVQVAELPDGEQLIGMYVYLGSKMVLATDKGVRVADLQTNGSIQYYGLTIDLTKIGSGLAYNPGGFFGRDKFAYVVIRGSAPGYDELCLYRIDLFTQTSAGIFAFASDQVMEGSGGLPGPAFATPTTPSLFVSGGSTGLYVTQPSSYLSDCFLLTSKIRFSTSEPKVYERVRIEADSGDGVVTASIVDKAKVTTAVVSVNPLIVQAAEDRIADSAPGKKDPYVSVKIGMVPSSTGTATKFHSYQLKALPAQKRQRSESVPVLIFDSVKDRTGQTTGYDGFAWATLRALETLEESGQVLRFQRFGGLFTSSDDRLVQIDSIQFVQNEAPPDRGSGFGGVAVLNLITVD